MLIFKISDYLLNFDKDSGKPWPTANPRELEKILKYTYIVDKMNDEDILCGSTGYWLMTQVSFFPRSSNILLQKYLVHNDI